MKSSVPLSTFEKQRAPLPMHMMQLADRAQFPDQNAAEVKQAIMGLVLEYIRLYFAIESVGELQPIIGFMREIPGTKVTDRKWRDYLDARHHAHALGIKTDADAVACLLDTRKTAALVEHIVFSSLPPAEASMLGVDLGSGTGILTIAAGIAAMRHGYRGIVLRGYDLSPMAVSFSGLIFEKWNKFFASEIRFEARHENLNSKIVFEDLRDELERTRMRLMLWISETWSHATEHPSVQGSSVHWAPQARNYDARSMEKNNDPFMTVVDHSVECLPDFLEQVRQGKTFMFPDIVHGDMRQREHLSALRLNDGGFKLLHHVGNGYEAFEDLGLESRWESREKVLREAGLVPSRAAIAVTAAGGNRAQRRRAEAKARQKKKK